MTETSGSGTGFVTMIGDVRKNFQKITTKGVRRLWDSIYSQSIKESKENVILEAERKGSLVMQWWEV